MALFREHILFNPEYSIGRALTSVILDQIRMEREGDVINHRPIKSCVYMLECLYESPDEIESENVYLTSFEGICHYGFSG
jgi:cullin 3